MLRRVHWSWAVPGLSIASSMALSIALLGPSLACGSGGHGAADGEDGPVETLSRFLETMDRSNLYESARKEAYAMLDETAQQALAERARRAALVSGREFSAWDMLAPGRFRLRVVPAERGGMRATVTGDHAVVHVVSEDGKDRVSVPMMRQGGRWRVQLAVPPVRREPRQTFVKESEGLLGLREQAPAGTARGGQAGQAGLPSLVKPPVQKP